jgi:hypothetical protein
MFNHAPAIVTTRRSERCVLMEKTERHVYHGRLGDEVIVLAIWGARRQRGPKL